MPAPVGRFHPVPVPAKTRSNATRLGRTFWIFSLTVLLAGAGVAVSAQAVAVADTPAAITNPAQLPEPVAWQQCPAPIVDHEKAEHNVVRTFRRAQGIAGGYVLSSGGSRLFCGDDNYGYYHIFNRHYAQWTQKSIKTSEDWQQVADYAIAEALSRPGTVTYRASNQTFCYSREIYTVNRVTGQIVDVFHPNVVVRRGDGAIITAYPAQKPCSG